MKLWPFTKRSVEVSRPVSPSEFKSRMDAINNGGQYDPEEAHGYADSLMADTLRGLGYGEGVDVFDGMTRWYA